MNVPTVPKIVKCLKMVKTLYGGFLWCYWTYLGIPNCIKVYPGVPWCIRADPGVPWHTLTFLGVPKQGFPIVD